MRFTVKDTLTEEEVQYGLKALIRDGLASTSMATLTGGAEKGEAGNEHH